MRWSGYSVMLAVYRFISFVIIIFVLLGCIYSGSAETAYADTLGGGSATDFSIKVSVGGNVILAARYTINQLQSMGQTKLAYSAVDSMPAPNIVLAKGILLTDILSHTNIDINNVQSIKIYSTDGGSHSYTKSFLFGSPRYYYPGIVADWDQQSESLPAFLPGIEDNKSPVAPMFALQSYQERFGTDNQWDKLNGNESVKFCFGQSRYDEATDKSFAKYVNRMDVVLNDGTPFIALNTPQEGQYYRPGSTVKIVGTVENIKSVSLNITGPDGKTAVPERSLDAVGGTFSTDFNLPGNAQEGDYSISVSGTGDQTGYKAAFKLKVSRTQINEDTSTLGKSNVPVPGTHKPRVGGSGSYGPPSETLTIKVGYFGGPYVTKRVFNLSDFKTFPQVKQAYTFIDNMPAAVTDSAIGVKLTDILESSGIDANSVETLYFYCTDVKKGWYEYLPKSYLLDTKRYYYPNLPTHWDMDTQSATFGATEGAIPVDTIISSEDNWQRFGTEPDFSDMDTTTRYRLVFGQNDTVTHTASRSAKWIHTIEVMLGGTPAKGITLDKNFIDEKVGSTFQLNVDFVDPEKTTDKRITWSSSDPGIARVDKNGRVKILKPGAVTITATTVVGNKTATCVINDPEKEKAAAITAASAASGSDGKGQQGGGSGQQGDGSGSGKGTLVEKGKAYGGTKASTGQAQGGVQPWRVFQMSEDSSAMAMTGEQNGMNVITACAFLLLLLTGSGIRYREFAIEMGR